MGAASEMRADIEERIRSGELGEGARLPSERALSLRYGVSRTVVREALKSLQGDGLIRSEVGRGNFVHMPGADDLAQRFESALDCSAVSAAELLQAREVIETAIGALVVEQISEEKVGELGELCDGGGKGGSLCLYPSG